MTQVTRSFGPTGRTSSGIQPGIAGDLLRRPARAQTRRYPDRRLRRLLGLIVCLVAVRNIQTTTARGVDWRRSAWCRSIVHHAVRLADTSLRGLTTASE